MEPVSMAALGGVLAKVAGGAAGEAGRQAWSALVSLVRGRFGAESPVTDAVERAGTAGEAGPVGPVDAAAGALVGAATVDPEFGARLREWLASSQPLVSAGDGAVTNVITGQVHGSAVQAGTIGGSVTIGSPAPEPRDQRTTGPHDG